MSTPPAAPAGPDPFPPGWQRLAALSGVGFAVLLVISILFLSGDTPDFDAPVTEWSEYAQDNDGKLRIGALVMALAGIELLWFVGYVRSVLGGAELEARGFNRLSYIVLAGGIVGAIGLCLGVFASAVAVSHVDASPDVIRGISDLGGAAFGLASVGFATMLYTSSFLILRLRPVPSWLGWVALAGGLSFLLQLGILLSDDFDNAFGVFYPLGFLALIVWSLGMSLAFLRAIAGPPAQRRQRVASSDFTQPS